MVFAVFAIFVMFIGTSSAQVTDSSRIESLHQIHTLVNAYFKNLANIRDGLNQLNNFGGYTDYLAQNQVLSVALADMAYNNSLPNNLALHRPVAPVEQLITAWRNHAIAVLNYCTVAIDTYIQNRREPNTVSFIPRMVVSSTMQLMWSTEDNRHIIDQHRRQGFPIHADLLRIVDAYTLTYPNDDHYVQFEQNFGGPLPPPQE